MRYLKTILKVAGSLLVLLLLMVGGLAIYMNSNKEKVFGFVLGQLKDNINGTLNVRSMESSVLRNFPNISVRLHDVAIRDSLWQVHHHELFRAKDVFVSMNVLSFISGNTRIHKVEVEHAMIHTFTDDSGYSNVGVFKKKDSTDEPKKKKVPYIDNVVLSDVLFTIENKPKLKYFQFDIQKLATAFDYNDSGWASNTNLNTTIRYMMFNTSRGGFLKGKHLVTNLEANYNRRSAIVSAPVQKFMIDEDKVDIGLMFAINQKPAIFIIDIKANAIKYRNVLAMLSDPITSKLEKFDFKEKIDVQAIIKGKTKYRDTPYVSVTWQIKNNTMLTPGGEVDQCTFTGIFNNQREKGEGFKDDNALIELKGLKGRWNEIPFAADTLSISNIIHPVLEGRFRSNFDIEKLNNITAGSSFHFEKGKANMNIVYKGGVFADDTTRPYMYGYLQLDGVGMTYVPRGLSFTDSKVLLRFSGADLFVDDVRLRRGSTALHMQGVLLNFLNLYYTAPEKIIWDWKIKSESVNLNDFIPVLAARKTQVNISDSTAAGKVATQLNKFLDASSMRMNVDIEQLIYRQFRGEQLNGNILMVGNDIDVKDFSILHAGGKLKADVHVTQSLNTNNYNLTAAIEKVDVKRFFTAFENFGQNAVTDKNVNGILSMQVAVSGALKGDGTPVPYSINGTAGFKFTNGTLVNFMPFKLLSSVVFRNRNLDSITFRDMENRFTIQGDKIVIHPMFIESSALNIHVAGVYALSKTGTDINIDLPLRNPKKDELIENDELRYENSMKGIVLHLKATSDEDGKLKIKWNKGANDTPPKTSKKNGFLSGRKKE